MEKKDFKKLIKNLKENEVVYTILVPVIYFIYNAIRSVLLSSKYGIPIEFVEISSEIKILVGSLIYIFGIFIGIIFILYFLNKLENNEKSITLFFIFLLFEILLILLILANLTFTYDIPKMVMYGGTISTLLIILIVNIIYILCKEKIFIAFRVYVVLTFILAITIFMNKTFQVITYIDNGNKKELVAMGYRDGEYIAFDYDENKNEIYKFPAYMISASEVKEIELKKFYHLELIQSKKPE